MRFIKLALISIVFLFVLVTLISSLMPSRIRVSRAIDIDRPRDSLARSLQVISSWRQWNIFLQTFQAKTPQADTLYGGRFKVFLTARSDSLLESDWQQAGARAFSAGYRLIPIDARHTTLQWYFDFKLRWYPWEKFQGIIYDQQLGPDMEKSLQNLKSAQEHLP